MLQAVSDGEVACPQCGAEHAVSAVCPDCGAVQALPPGADHFLVLGIARHLALDPQELERRYYELSRLLHPDRHQEAPPNLRAASLANTAALTRAYRTLRDPLARGSYWLELHGEAIGKNNKTVPPELAALVFEVQERLDEYRAAADGRRAQLRRDINQEIERLRQRQADLLAEVQGNFQRWDSGAAPKGALAAELKSLLSARAYLDTLVRDVERALEI